MKCGCLKEIETIPFFQSTGGEVLGIDLNGDIVLQTKRENDARQEWFRSPARQDKFFTLLNKATGIYLTPKSVQSKTTNLQKDVKVEIVMD